MRPVVAGGVNWHARGGGAMAMAVVWGAGRARGAEIRVAVRWRCECDCSGASPWPALPPGFRPSPSTGLAHSPAGRFVARSSPARRPLVGPLDAPHLVLAFPCRRVFGRRCSAVVVVGRNFVRMVLSSQQILIW